jgi:PAS domain S-box-containing protein
MLSQWAWRWRTSTSPRFETLAIVGTTSLVLFCGQFAIARSILLNSFTRLEEEKAHINAERVQNALFEEVDQLNRIIGDWSVNDETYNFVEGRSPSSPIADIANSIFTENDIDTFILTDRNGQVVVAKGFDLSGKQPRQLPPSLVELATGNGPLQRYVNSRSQTKGIVVLPEGVLLLAVRPIVQSNYQGPIIGTALMGRFLDQDEVMQIGETTRLAFNLFRKDDPHLRSELQAASTGLSAYEPVSVRALDDESIVSYSLVHDIFDRPAAILRVEMEREIYAQGKASLAYYFWSTLGISIAFCSISWMLLEKSRKALQESERRFRTMADSAPVMIWMSDAIGQCSFVNQSWLRYTGRTLNQELRDGWLETIHPADAPRTMETYRLAFDQRQSFKMEYRLRQSNGPYHWFLSAGTPRFTPSGDFTGFIGSLIDITERKQAEEAKDRLFHASQTQVEELAKLNKLKDDFLSTVSHELRTPVSNMKVAIELLKLAPSQEHQQRYFKILEAECLRETQLVNNLLDLQRLETGSVTPEVSEICLQSWLPQVVESFAAKTQDRQQQLSVKVDGSLPALYSDRSSLSRVVTELVTNACKYTPEGGRIEVVVEPEGDSNVEIRVSNSGIHIPEAELSRIFEKFYRMPSGDPWKQGGTGLGLALVKRVVEQLGGSVEATSQIGWTSFSVRLPSQARCLAITS